MTSPCGSFWRKCLIILLALLQIQTLVSAQFDSLRMRRDVFRLADGVVHTLSSPVRWDGKDLATLGALVAGTTVLTFVDQPVRHFFQSRDNRFLDGVERIGYHYGKPYTAVGLSTGFYLSGVIFKSEWAKETGMMLGASIFSSSLVMGALKNGAGRGRPGATVENLIFEPFSKEPQYHAFPSGHSSVAFGLSLLLAKRVESIPLKIVFYSLAGTTAVSRLYSDSHWLSDIAFGGVLAWFCADTAMTRIQMNRFRGVHRQSNTLVWKVYPYPGGLTLRGAIH